MVNGCRRDSSRRRLVTGELVYNRQARLPPPALPNSCSETSEKVGTAAIDREKGAFGGTCTDNNDLNVICHVRGLV